MGGMESPLQAYLENTSLLAYFSVFVAGLLTSFTPCIYPMIPITIGIVGGREQSSRLQAFFLTLTYVTGLAITYSLLGVIASMSGHFFGQVSANRWTLLIVSNIIILFGLSMLDVFVIPLPSFFQGAASGKKRSSFIGVFFMGMASGLIAAPCTTPVLGVLLTYVATKKSVLYGSSLLFVFAFGMNMLLLAIGTFTGLVTALPKSGLWMVRIKKLMGYLMIGVGEYFLIQAGKVWM